MNVTTKERKLRRLLTVERTMGRKRRNPQQQSDQQRNRKEEMKWRSRVAGRTCSREPAFIASDIAAVDTVLLLVLVIAPGFKLNGCFRFSGHCTAQAPTFLRPRQLIRSTLKLFSIPVEHLLKFGAPGSILLRDHLNHMLLFEIIYCDLLHCRLTVRVNRWRELLSFGFFQLSGMV